MLNSKYKIMGKVYDRKEAGIKNLPTKQNLSQKAFNSAKKDPLKCTTNV